MNLASTPKRCAWATGASTLMQRYHDEEWGVPVHDDRRHFEFLILEAAQAGLSWSVVLNKREGYRRAFRDFDPHKVVRLNCRSVERLMQDTAIVRNRLKIEAAIANARPFLALQESWGSFDAYIWSFVDGRARQNRFRRQRQVPASTPASDALSRDLKQRGFRFVGSTVIYAHMQATGMVNDHLLDCFRHRHCATLR